MSETTSTTTNTATKLRFVADLLDQHPDLPHPCVFTYGNGTVEVTWQLMNDADTKDAQKDHARSIIAAIGGKWDKHPWDDRFDFSRQLGEVKLQIFAHRDQLCERVVLGTEEVTLPAVEAKPERTETREVVEWRCTPLLADDEPAEQVSA
jgi:hypothetical protein